MSVVTGFGGAPGLDSMLAMHAKVTDIVTGWSLSASGSGGPQSLNPYLHLMKCCVGPLRMVCDGQMVEVDPLCRVELDYPQLGKITGWTISSPEAITLQADRPTVRSNMNLMFADDATVTALQQLATMVRTNALSLSQAAEMVAAASADPVNKGNRSSPSRLFGWARGIKDGRIINVAAELRDFPSFYYDLAGKALGASAALFNSGAINRFGAQSIEHMLEAKTYIAAVARTLAQDNAPMPHIECFWAQAKD